MRSQTPFARFGQTVSPMNFTISYVVLRIAMGFMFLWAGLSKLLQGDWSAQGYLLVADGPFAEWFQSLAGSVFIDQLNIWGLILIGASLLLGLLVRPAAFFGIALMALYYLAHFAANTEHGIIDDHIIYALVLCLFLAGGAGHMFGLDALVHANLRKGNRVLKWLFR